MERETRKEYVETKTKNSSWALLGSLSSVLGSLSSVLSLLTVLLMALVSFYPVADKAALKGKAVLYVSIFLGFTMLLIVMFALVGFVRRKAAKATAMKRAMIHAFSNALDKSYLNPKRSREDSDA
jgi:ABC-type amino acid transport system permease subunit